MQIKTLQRAGAFFSSSFGLMKDFITVSVLPFIKSVPNVLYSVFIFNLYCFLILGSSAYMTPYLFREEVIEEPETSYWGSHYLWFSVAAIIATIISGLAAGVSQEKLKKYLGILINVPQAIAWTVLTVMMYLVKFKYEKNLGEENNYLYIMPILIPATFFVSYHSFRLGFSKLKEYIRFNKYHFIWLSIPLSFYFVGFTYALVVVGAFMLKDIIEAILSIFDFSFWGYIKKGLLQFLLGFVLIFVAMIKLILNYLLGLSYKVWKFPLQYGLGIANNTHGKSYFHQLKSWALVILILSAGVPIASLIQYVCYVIVVFVSTNPWFQKLNGLVS